jgi:hypothetical protein
MPQGRVEIRRIKAIDDQGNEVTIIEIKPTDFRRTVNGQLVDVSPPYTIFELADGEPVNKRHDGAYEVVRTGEVLREIV